MFNYLDSENNHLVFIYNCDRCYKIARCVIEKSYVMFLIIYEIKYTFEGLYIAIQKMVKML